MPYLATTQTARALARHVKFVELLSCKQIKMSFDPFASNVRSIREFLFILSPQSKRSTNYNCGVKVDVKSDRSLPLMEVMFVDGHKALFKTENLTTLEITKYFNKLCQEHSKKP